MEALAVSNLIAGGETSRVQFKLNVTNVTSIAQEMVAFANTRGGMILIGVHDKTGQVDGCVVGGLPYSARPRLRLKFCPVNGGIVAKKAPYRTKNIYPSTRHEYPGTFQIYP